MMFSMWQRPYGVIEILFVISVECTGLGILLALIEIFGASTSKNEKTTKFRLVHFGIEDESFQSTCTSPSYQGPSIGSFVFPKCLVGFFRVLLSPILPSRSVCITSEFQNQDSYCRPTIDHSRSIALPILHYRHCPTTVSSASAT
jgi:hypothetical protein